MFDVELQVIFIELELYSFARRIVWCLVKLRASRCLM